MDVKTAFLIGTVDHDFYMSQPEGFIDPDHPDYVCKIKKSLYGLKQCARCWNQTLDNFKSRLNLIVRVNVVLNRTVVVDSDRRFDNLCGSHLQSQSELYHDS